MHDLTRILLICGATGGLSLAGCGKKPDAANSPTPPETSQAAPVGQTGGPTGGQAAGQSGGHGQEVSLGSTSVGDLTVECWQGHGMTEPGKLMHIVVKLPYNDTGATVVRAWIGTEDRLASTTAKGAYAPSRDDYGIHVNAPAPLPAAAQWWIEVERPDGTTAVGSIALR